jgi:hypothetical protein
MKLVFIIAIVFLGLTTAQGQTALPPNSQINSSAGAVGAGSLSAPASSLPSMSSPSPASQFGTASRSPTATGSASGATGAIGSASGISQSPLLLPGEIPDTSTQAASTTATAPSASSPICAAPVPSTDGGSANLSEITGASLGGC